MLVALCLDWDLHDGSWPQCPEWCMGTDLKKQKQKSAAHVEVRHILKYKGDRDLSAHSSCVEIFLPISILTRHSAVSSGETLQWAVMNRMSGHQPQDPLKSYILGWVLRQSPARCEQSFPCTVDVLGQGSVSSQPRQVKLCFQQGQYWALPRDFKQRMLGWLHKRWYLLILHPL